MTNVEIDRLIIDACDHRFRKVAAIMYRVHEASGLFDKPWGKRKMTKRLRTLVRQQKLHGAGNVFNWRASEVKLPYAAASDIDR